MRIILTAVSLMLVWVMSFPLRAQPKEPVLPQGNWPQQVSGRGETEESAKEVALREAVKEINGRLRKYVVTEEYVRDQVLADSGQAGKEIKVDGIEPAFKEWVLTFKSDPDWWRELVRRDQIAERIGRAEARQTLVAHMVVGLLVVLLCGFGYVQLDQWTQHRHTTWLRVAGISAASVALGVGWLVMRWV